MLYVHNFITYNAVSVNFADAFDDNDHHHW